MSAKINDVSQAAQSLEAYFLRRVLAEVRTSDEAQDGGFAGGMFKEMLDESLSDAMSKAGGVGIAQVVERQLKPTPTHTSHHAAAKAYKDSASSSIEPGRPKDWR